MLFAYMSKGVHKMFWELKWGMAKKKKEEKKKKVENHFSRLSKVF